MSRVQAVKLLLVAVIAFATVAMPITPALAQEGECPPDTICFEAGVACPDFALKIDVEGNARLVSREFYDAEGNLTGTFMAGKGMPLTYTNLSTGATTSTKANGVTEQAQIQEDGSRFVVATGHWLVILFPTDEPAGPATNIYVGRLTYLGEPSGKTTILDFSGKMYDICAALSD